MKHINIAIVYDPILKPETEVPAKNAIRNINEYKSQELMVSALGHINWFDQTVNACIIYGGDGLLISTANKVAPLDIPIIGVNYGRVGYLCKIEPTSEDSHLLAIFDIIDDIVNNKLRITERTRISAYINKKYVGDALNEITIGGINRTVYLNMMFCADKKYFFKSIGDGILISTRTGSTAYNKSAGGSVVFDDNVFSIVANNPALFESKELSLSIKSFIVPSDTIFELSIGNKNEDNLPYLICDGQRSVRLYKDDVIEIKKSQYTTKFIDI